MEAGAHSRRPPCRRAVGVRCQQNLGWWIRLDAGMLREKECASGLHATGARIAHARNDSPHGAINTGNRRRRERWGPIEEGRLYSRRRKPTQSRFEPGAYLAGVQASACAGAPSWFNGRATRRGRRTERKSRKDAKNGRRSRNTKFPLIGHNIRIIKLKKLVSLTFPVSGHRGWNSSTFSIPPCTVAHHSLRGSLSTSANAGSNDCDSGRRLCGLCVWLTVASLISSREWRYALPWPCRCGDRHRDRVNHVARSLQTSSARRAGWHRSRSLARLPRHRSRTIS